MHNTHFMNLSACIFAYSKLFTDNPQNSQKEYNGERHDDKILGSEHDTYRQLGGMQQNRTDHRRRHCKFDMTA